MFGGLKRDLFFILTNAQAVDFLTYGWLLLAFILILFLSVYCAVRWWWQVGLLISILNFLFFIFGIYYSHEFLNKKLREVSIDDVKTSKLTYSNSLVVDINITNRSKKILKICKFDLKFYKPSSNFVQNYFSLLKPVKKKSIILDESLTPLETRVIHTTVKNISFVDYNTTIKAECF